MRPLKVKLWGSVSETPGSSRRDLALQSSNPRIAGQPGGNDPVANRAFVGNGLDQRGRFVFVVHPLRDRRGAEEQAFADAVAGLEFLGFARHGAGGSGIGEIVFDAQGEGQFGRADDAAPGEERFGDGDDAVFVGVGHVDDGQFVLAAVFGVRFGAADFEAHLAFGLEDFGDELAGKEEDQAGVNHDDAGAPALEFEALDVGGEKVQEQDQPDEPAAGENGNPPVRPARGPVNKKAAKEFGLHGVKAQMDLRQRPAKDEHDGQTEANDGQSERGKKAEKAREHGLLILDAFDETQEVIFFPADQRGVAQ